jgi:hypothetical protein
LTWSHCSLLAASRTWVDKSERLGKLPTIPGTRVPIFSKAAAAADAGRPVAGAPKGKAKPAGVGAKPPNAFAAATAPNAFAAAGPLTPKPARFSKTAPRHDHARTIAPNAAPRTPAPNPAACIALAAKVLPVDLNAEVPLSNEEELALKAKAGAIHAIECRPDLRTIKKTIMVVVVVVRGGGGRACVRARVYTGTCVRVGGWEYEGVKSARAGRAASG